uniref:endonuclease 4-like isoform X2 n=1 Tax=Erigeron canadensis TaxID=72917 RepID=UPI001CB8AAA4|nr:endonuclease 4-like isoform X2 [Erigeron canadensis]
MSDLKQLCCWIKGTFAILLLLIPGNLGWGKEGHYATCKIAESFLSEEALKAVKELLPENAEGNLSSVCSWPDQIKYQYKWRWTSELHYVDTPDFRCNYDYSRDCHDSSGVKDRCVTGAIYNYTEQLVTGYNASNSAVQYNLTEALMFLSHYIGDVHQDTWSNDFLSWTNCSSGEEVCPDPWASESIKCSCNYAYRNATPGSTLGDDYFLSRLPIVEMRLAQGGVRLAATLNRIFDPYSLISQELAYFGNIQPTSHTT